MNYQDKLKILLKNKIALWDVIESCNREGSLDTDIKNEIPNNITDLLKQYPNIKGIILNGSKAYSAFKKYFPDLLKQYKCYKLPSSSESDGIRKLFSALPVILMALKKGHPVIADELIFLDFTKLLASQKFLTSIHGLPVKSIFLLIRGIFRPKRKM